MSRIMSLIALAIVGAFISSDRIVQAVPPTTQPDLGSTSAVPKATGSHNQTPANLPYRIQSTTHSTYTPDLGATLGHFQFNGKTVYLVGPMIAEPVTHRVASPQTPQHVGPELISR